VPEKVRTSAEFAEASSFADGSDTRGSCYLFVPRLEKLASFKNHRYKQFGE